MKSNINDTVRQLSKMVEILTQLLETQNSGQHNPLVPSGASCRNPEFPFQEPMPMLCDYQYEGGGWTVIQRRADSSVDFFRDWQDYKRGFGFMHDEF